MNLNKAIIVGKLYEEEGHRCLEKRGNSCYHAKPFETRGMNLLFDLSVILGVMGLEVNLV